MKSSFKGNDDVFIKLYDKEVGARKRNLVKVLNQILEMILTTAKRDKLTGQVLKVQTARLRSSVIKRIVVRRNTMQGYVGTNVWYGKLWETGEARGFKVRKPKPWLKPSIDENLSRAERLIKKAGFL